MDDFLESQGSYPYFEAFVTTYKIREGYENREKGGPHIELSAPMSKDLGEIEGEMDKGTIAKNNPVRFVMNMFSLLAYPVLMKQMYRRLFNISEEEYSKILKDRKQLIMNILFPMMKTGTRAFKR